MALSAGETFGTTIAAVEEQMRGWLATIAKERQVRRQVKAYRELARMFTFFRAFVMALFDEVAAGRFDGEGEQVIHFGGTTVDYTSPTGAFHICSFSLDITDHVEAED